MVWKESEVEFSLRTHDAHYFTSGVVVAGLFTAVKETNRTGCVFGVHPDHVAGDCLNPGLAIYMRTLDVAAAIDRSTLFDITLSE